LSALLAGLVRSALLLVLLSTLTVASLSVLVAARLSFRYLAGFLDRMVGFSIGILLTTAWLHLLPDALRDAHDNQRVLAVVLASLFGFFFLQKLALYRHDHHFEGDGHAHGPGHDVGHAGHGGALVLIGSTLHNFSDGVLIAGAYLAGPGVGLAASLSILTHEVPHKISDLMVLTNAGMAKRRALVYTACASAAIVLGGLVGCVLLQQLGQWIPLVLAAAAANFIYISLSDLVPRMRRSAAPAEAIWQAGMIGFGVFVVLLLNRFADL
jgi:zinc and cadmium transporter